MDSTKKMLISQDPLWLGRLYDVVLVPQKWTSAGWVFLKSYCFLNLKKKRKRRKISQRFGLFPCPPLPPWNAAARPGSVGAATLQLRGPSPRAKGHGTEGGRVEGPTKLWSGCVSP